MATQEYNQPADRNSPGVFQDRSPMKYELGEGSYVVKLEPDNTPETSELLDWCIQKYYPDYKNLIGTDKRSVQKCLFCSQVFDSRSDLYHHNLTHFKILIQPLQLSDYQCKFCSRCFYSKTVLKSHIDHAHNNLDSKPEKAQCPICLKKVTLKYLNEHQENVHGREQIKCDLCKYTFRCERYYRKHRCMKSNPKHRKSNTKVPKHTVRAAVTCEECSKVLPSKISLTCHLKNVHNIIVKDGRKVLAPKQLDCNVCGTVFKSYIYLNTHMRRVHCGQKSTHRCPQCNKKFKSKRRVRIHMKNAHFKTESDRKPQTCKTCSKVFQTPYLFKKHAEKCTELNVKTEDVKIEIDDDHWEELC